MTNEPTQPPEPIGYEHNGTAWAPFFATKEEAMRYTLSELGRKGGSAKSARKTAAARANGQKNAERVRALQATRPTPETPGNSTQEPAKGA